MALFSNILGKGPKTKLPVVDIRGRFQILGGLTGKGSMATVNRARDSKGGGVVCVKVLNRDKWEQLKRRFERNGLTPPVEGEVCMALRHKNVVRAFEYGLTTNKEMFIVFEFIDGPGFNLMIDTKNPQLVGKRVKLLMQACEALEYVHQQGYVHRDVCPRNMMIDPDGTLKLIDFGLSIPKRKEYFRPGVRTGTAHYMPPELIKRGVTDERVDLFALGVTAFEAITGTLPWPKAENTLTIMNDHINRPPSNPRGIRRDLDERTARVLLKAIEGEPAKRYQCAAEFRDALKTLPADL
jgi:serine/threonine protein kinase